MRRCLPILLFVMAGLAAGPSHAAPPAGLREAALQGNLAKVQQILKKSPNVLKTKDGVGMLCMAAYSGNRALVTFMLSKGSKINEADYDGSTPLHQAASAGNRPLIEFLLSRGARINQRGPYGWTPLHSAAASADRATVALLVAKGANVNAQGMRKDTPLDVAIKYRNDAIAAFLSKRTKK